MKGDDGRVLVAGFNDGIQALSPEERAMVDAVPDDSAEMLKTFGIAGPSKAFPRLQDALQYPTLNVRGLVSAHVGAGARTIIPDRATAAMDIRLVKETRPDDLVEKVRAHVRAQGYYLVDGEPTDSVRAMHSKIAAIAVSETPTERLPDVAARSAGEAHRRWPHEGVRCSTGAASDARRHGPDCALHRCSRLSSGPRADGQLRQQSARGERESQAWAPVSGDRDNRGDPAELTTESVKSDVGSPKCGSLKGEVGSRSWK